MSRLESRVVDIEQRNKTVESDKAWEMSISRKVVIAVLTYVVIVLLFILTGTAQPFLNALVATLAFVLSTLSLPVFQRLWLAQVYNKRHNKNMKTITCIDCQEQFIGATPEEVQMAMLPHYKSVHAEIINSVDDSGKKEWFAEFNKRWEAAEEA